MYFYLQSKIHHQTNNYEKYHKETQNMVENNYIVKEIYKYIIIKVNKGKYGI